MTACSSLDINLFCFNVFNSFHRSKDRCSIIICIHTFKQNVSNVNGLPTHNLIANSFDAISDVVSLEKSKEL